MARLQKQIPDVGGMQAIHLLSVDIDAQDTKSDLLTLDDEFIAHENSLFCAAARHFDAPIAVIFCKMNQQYFHCQGFALLRKGARSSCSIPAVSATSRRAETNASASSELIFSVFMRWAATAMTERLRPAWH